MKPLLNVLQIRTYLMVAFLSLVLLHSCGDEDDSNRGETSFDRSAMLASVADNLIIPNFVSLQTSVNTLVNNVNNFNANTNSENLNILRSSWVEVVKNHQHCSAFGFGPAAITLGSYASVLGAFPVDEQAVEANILNPDFDLVNSFARDIRGFYTIEYLIYGNGQSDSELINGFSEERKNYLLLLANELKTTFDAVVSEWQGSYRAEFISSDGTSAGSSISQYYNEFVKDYEILKNFKVELPAGLTAGGAGPNGALVEGFYSGLSTELIREQFNNSKNIWFGRARDGQQIIGFEAYLNSVVGGEALVEATIPAIDRIDNAITALPQGPLSENVADPSLVTLRDELQANTANFKSSMSSLLGITITFNSGDGD
jgi:hypothetical protein